MGLIRQQDGTKKENLTEQSIQKRLNRFFASYKYKADGLYVFSWESDKLIWTKAGYIYEFEIKISRTDFKNDFKSKKKKHATLASTTMGEGKRMPNYFYYAVPTGMIVPDDVPPYAGLIYIDSEYRYVAQSFRIVKKAPRLHSTKYTDAELNLGEKFYYNWQTALRNLHDAAKRANDVEGRLKRELDRQHHDRTWEELERDLAWNKEEYKHYRNLYYQYQHNALCDRNEIRRLRAALLKLQPDFDYKSIEQEVEKYYGKRTLVE